MVKKRADNILLLICLIIGIIPVFYYLNNNYFFYPEGASLVINNKDSELDSDIEIAIDGTNNTFQLYKNNKIKKGTTTDTVSLDDLNETGTLVMSIGTDKKYIVSNITADTNQVILIATVTSLDTKKNQVTIDFKGKKDNVKFSSTITFNLPE